MMTRPTYERVKLIIVFSLLQPLTGGLSGDQNHSVHCSSSYIDDYFLPTAKIALNKIQQSFTPSSSVDKPSESLPKSPLENRSIDFDYQQQQQSTTTERQPPADSTSEPGRDEFINLQVRPESERGDEAARVKPVGQEEASSGERVLDATESSSEDPAAAVEVSTEGAPVAQRATPAEGLVVGAVGDSDERQAAAAATEASQASTIAGSTTTSTAATAGRADEAVVAQYDGSPAAAAADEQPSGSGGDSREAMREGQAAVMKAVEATLNFGNVYGDTSNACYDEYGNARYCEPDFENVAYERPVEVSSECGHPPSRFCTSNLNERNDQIRNCHICDAQHPKKRHPAAYLTDANNPNAPTCWVSAPISAPTGVSAAASVVPSFGNSSADGPTFGGVSPQQRDNVTLAINLEKRYEISYISLQFCSLKPDSLAIWKSADFGKTWTPFQFYSSQCGRFYERPVAPGPGGVVSAQTNQIEAACFNSSASGSSQLGSQAGRVVFSTSIDESNLPPANAAARNKPVGEQTTEVSAAQQDWMTVTNIRIVLDRHQASWIQSSLGHAHHHQLSNQQQQQQQQQHKLSQSSAQPANKQQRANPAQASNSAGRPSAEDTSSAARQPQANASISAGQGDQQQALEASLTNPSDTYNYALSDLAIGGQCKCNGHAWRCIHNAEGQLACDCQHNTDGPDCERCLPLHHDRPWQRATQTNANPCQPCHCNGHSRKCRFDSELYLLSGKRSGGVCIDCKDNTTGRHCNYCREGFTRDHTKPMSSQGACKPCDCHPVGSLGKVCNHVTGQCPCKEGVIGFECNRCAPGYQQSSSPTEPCIKIPENDINYEPVVEAVVGEDSSSEQSSVAHQPNQEQDQDPSLEFAQESAPSVGRPSSPAESPAKQSPLDNNRIDADSSAPDDLASPAEQELQLRTSGDIDNQRPQTGFNNHRSRHHHQHQHQQQQQQQQSWHNTYPQQGGRLSGGGSGDLPRATSKGRKYKQPVMMDAMPLDDWDYESAPPPPLPRSRHGFHRGAHRAQPSKRPILSDDDIGYAADYRPAQQLGGGQAPMPIRPVVNLDQADDDQTGGGGGGGQDERLYGNEPDLTRALYGQDDLSFNQIMRPAFSSRHEQSSHRRQLLEHQQQQYRRRLLANSRARSSLQAANCAGCQAKVKKLNARQFCHLDYAVRATVISKRASSDWTRFEVEIQDIFKSPSSSSLVQQALETAAPAPATATSATLPAAEPIDQKTSNYLRAGSSDVQSDDPGAIASAGNGTVRQSPTTPIAEQANSIQVAAPEHPIHRLRIGSVQSIWVPTEDVACKCPRLKLHASYLLMGLVDLHGHSSAATQLDRHGVAMAWRASLQEKLIKYQRLQSDGLCWRMAAAAAAAAAA